MRSTNPSDTTPSAGCRPCAAAIAHCHGTLVLHADGGSECDGSSSCQAREDLHDWWMSCVDLGCGCTGDEHPSPLELLAA